MVRVGLVVAIALVVGACDSASPRRTAVLSDSVDRSYGLPILRSEVRPEGTPLLDGLSVPAGAALAGTSLPEDIAPDARELPPADHEWSAVLGIRGTPRSVVDALLEQASSAGWCCLPRAASCVTYVCQAYTQEGISLSSPQGHTLYVHIVRESSHRTWGEMRVIDWGGRDQTTPAGDASDPSEEAAPGPLATTPPAEGDLPSVGELVGFGSYRPGFTTPYRIKVESGSAMVTPVLEERAVLRVTGDPSDVRDAYTEQLRKFFPKARIEKKQEHRGAWTVDIASAEGGVGSGTVELFRRPGVAYVRLSFATDEEFEP